MSNDSTWQSVGEVLKLTKAKGKKATWCVVGAGNGGLSMAGIWG